MSTKWSHYSVSQREDFCSNLELMTEKRFSRRSEAWVYRFAYWDFQYKHKQNVKMQTCWKDDKGHINIYIEKPLVRNKKYGQENNRQNSTCVYVHTIQTYICTWVVSFVVKFPAAKRVLNKYEGYLHEADEGHLPQIWFSSGPGAEIRPSQNRCRSGSMGGSGPVTHKTNRFQLWR